MKKFSHQIIAAFLIFTAIFITSCNSSKVKTSKLLQTDSAIVNGQLENGMNYYIMKNGEPKNRISLRLVVRAGSCMEEDDQKGVAHFVEHMCFNGTENFEKNSLIDYAESIGMEFGPEVNAYTSFEETVYQLEIPADNPEYLEKALLIFHDWASAVTFDPVELDKERGVIVEEWRGKQGLNWRLSTTVLPFELKDSAYVDRLPIGDMDIIQNISRDRVMDFYKKWYRPEFISVVVAGEVDPQVVTAKIKDAMDSIPASAEKINHPSFDVTPRTEKDVLVFKDAEMPYVQAQFVLQQADYHATTTEDDFRREIASEMLGYVMNIRLTEITQSAEAPWLAANVSSYNETNSSHFDGMAFVPKDGMFTQSVKAIFDEVDRFIIFGVTESELQRARDYIIASATQNYEQRLGIDSPTRVSNICSQVITGRTDISDEDRFNLSVKNAKSITVEEINSLADELFVARGNMAMIYAPQSADLPSKEEILDIWNNYKNEEIAAYEDDVAEGGIMERPSSKAKVVSKNDLDGTGVKEYVLENGIRILLKKTDFDKDLIYMDVLSKGGSSLVSDEEYPSLYYSAMYTINSGIGNMSFTQLQKFLGDKNLSLNLNVSDNFEEIYSTSPNSSIEYALQIVNQIFTNPHFEDNAWNYLMANAQTIASSYNVMPEDAYNSKIRTILHGDTVRYKGIDNDFVSLMDKKLSEKLFRERFANAGDFTFLFVGDLNEDKLIDLCRLYLGNLPSDATKIESANYNVSKPFPGRVSETVKKGQEKKGEVFIAFGGKLPAASTVEEYWKDCELMSQLKALLDIRLREIIREDKSGTYGVSVYCGIEGDEERNFDVQIEFGCEPEREQELTDEVIAAIKSIQSEETSSLNMEKLHETYRRTFETNKRSNWWVLNKIADIYALNYKPYTCLTDDTSVINWTTPEALKEVANKYLDTENYVSVYLVPEE